ncbi:MAG TPA: hypothetical protein VJV39_06695 [Dongiaceae bacterium]|nr:hypothetical protein [Dongiaceae bacterium]
MKRTAHLPTSIWPRQYPTASDRTLTVIRAVSFEFSQAIAAAHRYEELRLKSRACHDPDSSPARRVYLEFYSDR